jgi:hypothetical protein
VAARVYLVLNPDGLRPVEGWDEIEKLVRDAPAAERVTVYRELPNGTLRPVDLEALKDHVRRGGAVPGGTPEPPDA